MDLINKSIWSSGIAFKSIWKISFLIYPIIGVSKLRNLLWILFTDIVFEYIAKAILSIFSVGKEPLPASTNDET